MQTNLPGGESVGPENQPHGFGATRSHQPGNTEDLTAISRERNVTNLIAGPQTGHL